MNKIFLRTDITAIFAFSLTTEEIRKVCHLQKSQSQHEREVIFCHTQSVKSSSLQSDVFRDDHFNTKEEEPDSVTQHDQF